MSAPNPAIRLCNTINRLVLLPEIPFDPSYLREHRATGNVSAIDLLADRIVIKQDATMLEHHIEPLLATYASRLATCDDAEELTSVHNSCQPLPRPASNLLTGGDDGRAWFMQYVLSEVNAFLAHWPFRCARALTLGLKELGWRVYASGQTVEADNFELYAVLGNTTRRLAVFNYHSSWSVSNRAITDIESASKHGIAIVRNSGEVDVECSGMGYHFQRNEERGPLVETAVEWSREDSHITILSNYSCTYLFLTDTPHVGERGREQSVRMSRMIDVARKSHPGRMSKSLVGFLLGVSLYAVERLGLDLLAPPVLQQNPAGSSHVLSSTDASRPPFILGDQPVLLLDNGHGTFSPAKHISSAPVGVLYSLFTPSASAQTLPALIPAQHELTREEIESGISAPLTIELVAHRGRGIVWDAFSATHTGAHEPTPLVVKLTDLSTFAGPELEGELDIYTASRKDAQNLILAELRAYAGPLQALQGTAVPRLLGLVGGVAAPEDGRDQQREIWAVLLEDAGETLSADVRRLPSTKHDVLKLYAQLHAAGVLHGDPQWDHILAPPVRAEDDYRPALRLIDFGHADLREDVLAAGKNWEKECAYEMLLVEDLFLGRGLR